MMNYSVYHLHDETSLLDSCTNFKLYVDKAVELGQTAIAFTNHGSIYNWIDKKMYTNSKGLKYIHGVEIYLTAQLEPKIRDNYHTILLAKNYDGVKEINTLIGIATQPDHMYYKPRLSFEEFFNISDNVIKISACLASPLAKYPSSASEIYNQIENLKKEQKEKEAYERHNALKQYKEYYESCCDISEVDLMQPEPFEEWLSERLEEIKNYYHNEINTLNNKIQQCRNNYTKLLQTYDYYEIQPHVKSADQIKYNQMLYEASKQYGKPLIAGTDTHSINKYKAQCRSILQKAKRIEFSNEDEFDLTYKSYDELVEMFREQGSLPMEVILEAIENTNRMAASVEDFELDTSVKYPKLYDNEEQVFKELICRKLKEKVDNNIIDKKDLPKYKANIIEEMRVFKKINMVGFMLFMSELICWCWDNGIPVGYCRGSVGGSTIAYITDVIDVDPIKWNTIFSRFANEDREEVGDVDVDVSPDQRDLVYKHIIDTFGLDKTAYILAIGTISDKGTIDEIGRALEIPLDEVAHIKELYTSYKNDIDLYLKSLKELQNNTEFSDILYKNKEDFYEDTKEYAFLSELEKITYKLKGVERCMERLQKEQYPNVFYYFDGLNGTAVSQSYHPAGIVVSPITLPDNIGYFYNNEGKHILYINMEEIHDGAGLVKYDILALKNIEIIRKTCEYAGIPYPKSHQLNWLDKNVWDDLICSPAGVFQFESPYAFDLMKRYRPQCVNDLSMINASLRPSGASYRDRLLAGEINKNPSPLIDKLLEENKGFLIFQEDTIKFLQNICGLSGSAADNVRRAIGRKQMDRLQAALPQILEGYCNMSDQPREIAEEEAKAFLKIIEDSANYQFGYNHSTGYSMIGYTCGYCRYHYPEEFTAAYLNCASNDDDIKNGTELAKIKNITIHNIKFGKSESEYSVDKSNHALYKGLESIKFLNTQIGQELKELSYNEYSTFIDLLADIKNNTSVNSRQLEILIGLNFFSDYGKNKYLLELNNLYDKFATCKQIKKDKLDELGLSNYLMQKYSAKETAKIYKEIDNIGLINELSTRIENKPLSVVDQVKFEKEYLNYVVYTNTSVHPYYYIVTEFITYKNPLTPSFVLHNINTGKDIKTRIKKGSRFKDQPFGEYSILKIPQLKESNKSKMINGVWTKTEEIELILEDYEFVV